MVWQKLSLSPKTRLQLLVGIFAVGVLLAIWKFPQWQVKAINDPKERITAETAARATLIQGVGGLLLFGTAYISFLNLKATQRNVLIAEEKQVTERFSKAVEMLSHENSIHTRLGGIYALERIANDSDKDYWQVMEVLTAFVRERSPYRPYGEQLEGKSLSTDIQAVLTVLGRRKHSFGNGEEYGLDLTGTDLQGANLGKADFRGAYFIGANFQGANLQGVNFQGAWLVKANLQGVSLIKANLQEANLQEVSLIKANLQEANFQEARLRKANLRGTWLMQANFQKAGLEETNLQEADLEGANLQGANLQSLVLTEVNLQEARLRRANLQGTGFEEVNLQKAKLGGANLGGAWFREANLQEANFQGAWLGGANLGGALQLTQEQLAQAQSYEGAILPRYVQNLLNDNI